MNAEDINLALEEVEKNACQTDPAFWNAMAGTYKKKFGTDAVFKIAFGLFLLKFDYDPGFTPKQIEYFKNRYGSDPRENVKYHEIIGNSLKVVEGNVVVEELYKHNLIIRRFDNINLKHKVCVKKLENVIDIELPEGYLGTNTIKSVKIGMIESKSLPVKYYKVYEGYGHMMLEDSDIRGLYITFPESNWGELLKTKAFVRFPEFINDAIYQSWPESKKIACLQQYCELKQLSIPISELKTFSDLGLPLKDTVSFINNKDNQFNDLDECLKVEF